MRRSFSKIPTAVAVTAMSLGIASGSARPVGAAILTEIGYDVTGGGTDTTTSLFLGAPITGGSLILRPAGEHFQTPTTSTHARFYLTFTVNSTAASFLAVTPYLNVTGLSIHSTQVLCVLGTPCSVLGPAISATTGGATQTVNIFSGLLQYFQATPTYQYASFLAYTGFRDLLAHSVQLGNEVRVSQTPVPEPHPSTLVALGLGLLWLAASGGFGARVRRR